ncbi:SCO2195 family GlnR-regulated protein [Streptomyces alkaliterrae]|uniref:Uncharacterized protein n=1 Tax=Streptomyces alkaliterrae TaxID=2213162 RepID=A0A5P0YSV3_9ACTN|nr:hypothetical protein [Streptomyces alkaliterrae]MBB1257063.1 hypothetical protein [Streptomyces alkaliterrae]MBB1262294.1 hypothetical protein [Streptomyces alkaliterrae]MQS02687.1 hypothetical protein [Streptomyces alkaliterrae]
MREVTPVRPRLAETLRVLEGLLLESGQRTARRNAWSAVVENRSRARARSEAAHVLEAAAEGTSTGT